MIDITFLFYIPILSYNILTLYVSKVEIHDFMTK